MLYRLGFDENWIGVIMKCVTTVRYSFLINGQPRGYLTPTRGLRQGDPLSPYLFLLCAEVFSALLARKVTHGELQGIKICEGAPVIHHLLFADDSLVFGKATLSECQHIQSVLNAYELASGQQINFAKSSIVFSKRVPEADKLSLASFLGVAIEVKHEKYLGLPTYLGRNRTETFAYIKERLSKKLAGWQGKLLSGAGKDLLVRVVAQALPSYAMSCFLLPNNFCDDLHQMCSKFWWGSKPNERKIHWMSWERLCRSKEEGGMGFRDLHAHNLALLAKQGWRLIRYPGSLVSRLFKARYFPHSSFLNATTPTHSSSCWRGIFVAKSVLQAGLRWQVGNGTSIRIWDDPWIPRPNLFRSIRYGPSPLVLVSDLMVDGHWNKELIFENFHADEALLICSIPLSRSIVPDRLIWHFDMKGLFTTKIAYKIAFASLHPVLTSGSSSNSNPSHWKFIWAAPIPGKVKVHVWKVCASILPTASQLRSRRVPVEDGCLFCNSEEETLSHVSRECCFTRDVIGLAPDLLPVLHTPPSSLLDWLALCYTLVTPRAFAFLLMLLWGVWKEKNQRLWVGKGRTVQQVFCHTTSILHSYVVARHSVTPRLGRQVKPWSPPPAGWLKVNIDGAFDQGTRRGGLGIVVRDADSTVVAGACGQCSDVLQPLVVEALASRLACKLVEENSLAPVIFESDCLQLVQAIQTDGDDTSQLGRIVDDISLSISYLAGSFFSHVYRESNMLAHKLAKYALVSGLQISWSGHVPPGVSNLFCNN
ncbi:putative RNA-directed DNA polymerase [Rosa chinensis]|uniref:Putative RNA-directed DNA polymerase n=1 Tax=Rosa chinensis TaxID=74649 RepID=A0A2P6PGU0_ROSCH|nr:putative RNA-directed DNA polymerase [Rosa chinensis]